MESLSLGRRLQSCASSIEEVVLSGIRAAPEASPLFLLLILRGFLMLPDITALLLLIVASARAKVLIQILLFEGWLLVGRLRLVVFKAKTEIALSARWSMDLD